MVSTFELAGTAKFKVKNNVTSHERDRETYDTLNAGLPLLFAAILATQRIIGGLSAGKEPSCPTTN